MLKKPRVILPTTPAEVLAYGQHVYDETATEHGVMDTAAHPFANAVSSANADLDDVQGDLQTLYTEWLQLYNDAKAKRVLLNAKMAEQIDNLRNLRDTIFAAYPDEPTRISNFGFESYTTTAAEDQDNDGLPDPEDPLEDPPL